MSLPTLAEHAYKELRRRILRFELSLGERLHVDKIAEELQVSPSPVKEALKQLESEGLVEIRARRGTTVREFTPDDVRDIYKVRELLEPAAAVDAVNLGAITPSLLNELSDTIKRLEDASHGTKFEDPVAAIEADSAFHRTIVAATGNKVLTGIHSSLTSQAHLLRIFSTRSPRAADTIREHQEICDALVARDVERVHSACLRHLVSAREVLLKQIKSEQQRRPNDPQ